jgi:long-chain acyl-CoA synthetase
MEQETAVAGVGAVRCAAGEAEEARLRALMADAPASVAAMFLERVAKTPDSDAFLVPSGTGWRRQTWRQTAEVVTEIAAGLLALGVRPEDRVAIASSTRIDWVHADLAIMCAGAATTTVYPTSTGGDVEHIVGDSGSRLLVAEDAEQLAKLCRHRAGLPDLERVVVIDQPPAEALAEAEAAGLAVISLDRLRQIGERYLAEHPAAVTERIASVRPDHLATLIYTSGTTGRPKGVRLTQRCWVYEGLAAASIDEVRPEDVTYLWLPLSHSFGKVLLAAQIAIGHAAAVDGRLDRIVENLPVVRPTGMAGAPRIYEKVHARVNAMVAEHGGAKARIFAWSFDVGRRVSRLRQDGQRPGGLLALQARLADRLVFGTIRQRFGGRVRSFISGAAPLSVGIAEWFDAAGLRILEGYGLTETSAGSFVNRPDRYRLGTVGVPLPGTEVRIEDDGEVLIKGPGVMEGYHNLPEETAAVLTEDGWLRTGDIGEITPDGFLRITDRKKDLIKTSGGKYVAPQSIETQFKAICPLASQIVVHGDGRNYVTALIALDPEEVSAWAAAHGMGGGVPYQEVVTSDAMREAISGYVDRLNAGLGRWEAIKRFDLLDRDLTVEDGFLTPSLKLKRRVVERAYAERLDRLYAAG